MVFRGKPSKACERCRLRRLKCDLHPVSCGQCIRASIPCSGYRDTTQLRIRNESQLIAQKVKLIKNPPPTPPKTPSPKSPSPDSPTLSLLYKAQHAFFANYVTSRCWDFLTPYHHPIDAPPHLTLAIEAVSLAYLWHQLYSPTALVAAREKYVAAICQVNKILRSKCEVQKDTTLMTSLLLDLFEKITECEPRRTVSKGSTKSWSSHIEGALALVKLRGVEEFKEEVEFTMLARLTTHYICGCVASGEGIGDEMASVQDYLGVRRCSPSPVWKLTDLMMAFGNLRGGMGVISKEEYIQRTVELDRTFRDLVEGLPGSWGYSTIAIHEASERVFESHFDRYADPKICQARNFIRIFRLLLNVTLLNYYASLQDHASAQEAQHIINIQAREICASAPQYADCSNVSSCKSQIQHIHTPQHLLDVYTMMFPLYVAGMSEPLVKWWVVEQLRYVGEHFGIRNAELVAGVLEREGEGGGGGRNVWGVYRALGSYAFAS
ncbi:hypothetical protein B0J14DRAFT_594973 [Halenospora varia]|nr:hypothetical protein B0J14DRAFT_594973 [Halenospora varia]